MQTDTVRLLLLHSQFVTITRLYRCNAVTEKCLTAIRYKIDFFDISV
jgi:hypothetical protein